MISESYRANFQLFEFKSKEKLETKSLAQRTVKFTNRKYIEQTNQINIGNQLKKQQILSLPLNIKTNLEQFKKISPIGFIHKLVNNQFANENCRVCGINFLNSKKKCLYCEYNDSNNIDWYSNLSRLKKEELVKKLSSNSQQFIRIASANKSKQNLSIKIPRQETFYKIWNKMNTAQKQQIISKLKTCPNAESNTSLASLSEIMKVNCIKFDRPASDYGCYFRENFKNNGDKDCLNYIPILRRYGL